MKEQISPSQSVPRSWLCHGAAQAADARTSVRHELWKNSSSYLELIAKLQASLEDAARSPIFPVAASAGPLFGLAGIFLTLFRPGTLEKASQG